MGGGGGRGGLIDPSGSLGRWRAASTASAMPAAEMTASTSDDRRERAGQRLGGRLAGATRSALTLPYTAATTAVITAAPT